MRGPACAILALKKTANCYIFARIAPFRRTRIVASGQIDENGSLPYKPRQLSAMTRSDRGGSFGPEMARFGPTSISGLINIRQLARSAETTREADLSTQQTGAQAPSRLPRPLATTGGRKVLAARRARGRKRLSA